MKRVLIVDDAIDLGRLLQDALKVTRPDTPITVVPSAEEALLESTRFTFDLLITDLRLPGMSGLELIRKIRVRQPGIKVILITALMPEDRLVRQKDEVHPDVFIRKPLSVATFLDAVDGLIGSPQEDVEEPVAAVEISPVQDAASQANEEAEMNIPAAVEQVLAEQLAVEDISPVADPSQAGDTTAAVEQEEEIPEQDLFSELESFFPQKTEEVKPEEVVPSRDQPAPVMPAGSRTENISAILTRLKGSLGAVAVLLADDQGIITALVGDLPDVSFQEQLISAALAAVNGSTAVTYLLGTASSSAVQAFRGIDYDLVLAPVGSGMLMIVLPNRHSALRLAIAFEEALSAQDELAILQNSTETTVFSGNDEAIPRMEMLGVTKSLGDEEIDADLEETMLNMDPDLEKLNALFAGKMNGEADSEDLDTFWETAAGSEGKDLNTPGFLTYEQAQKLGLLKPDEEE